MGLFRKKPVLVEAVRFDGCEYVDDVPEPMFEGSFDIVPEWLTDARAKSGGEAGAVFVDRVNDNLVLAIVTLEGPIYASAGDLIIKGTAGEIYPCKPEIFAGIYDPADEAAARVLSDIIDGQPAEPPPGVGRHELTAGEDGNDD